jgi:hypothetical protein
VVGDVLTICQRTHYNGPSRAGTMNARAYLKSLQMTDYGDRDVTGRHGA